MTYQYKPTVHSEEELQAAGLDRGYHGSGFPLRGEHIKPSPEAGVPKTFSMSSDDVANYVAKRVSPEQAIRAENSAWRWAGHSTPAMSSDMRHAGNRPRVHEVVAEGHPMADTNLGWETDIYDAVGLVHGDPDDPDSSEYMQTKVISMAAPSLRVVGTQWTPPPNDIAKKAGRGVEGTLPHVNWKQFGADSYARNPSDTAMWGKSDSERERENAACLRLWADESHPSPPPSEVSGQRQLPIDF